MKKELAAVLILFLLMLGITVYFYPALPDIAITHWGINGEPNGFSEKTLAVALLPLISVILLLFFLAIPRIDPMKANIRKFRKHYDRFIIVIMAFLLYMQILTLVANLGFSFNISYLIIPPLAILFYFAGVIMQKSERNWFIGLRTPWTLSSDVVWRKSNELAGRLFKISSIIALVGLVFINYSIYFLIIPVMIAAVYSTVYSYFEYRKLKRRR